MKRVSLILFVLVGLAELVAGIFDIQYLHTACKPLIMITLGLYYSVYSTQRSLVVYLAILFSFIGDTTLMLESRDPIFFTVGLGAFLLAHVFYTLAYRQHQYLADDNALQGIQKMRFAFPVVLWGTGLVVVLYPTLGNLKIPVALYAIVLIVMVVNSIFRYYRTHPASFWLVFGGSVFFMISDSLLAINKFLKPVAAGQVWVMSTYMLAQFLIITGLCRHMNNGK
jgi:uncharacterized membrane protein YhhN